MLKNIRWTESRAVATSAGRVRSPTTTSAPSAQGIGTLVVVVRHRSYGLAALTQQRHQLAAHAADSPAGAGHQDQTRLSHRRLPSLSLRSWSEIMDLPLRYYAILASALWRSFPFMRGVR